MANHTTPRRQIGFTRAEFSRQDKIALAAGHRTWADAARLILLDGFNRLAELSDKSSQKRPK
jgi:hypothetical protein